MKQLIKKALKPNKDVPVLHYKYAVSSGHPYVFSFDVSILVKEKVNLQDGVYDGMDNLICDIDEYPKLPDLSVYEKIGSLNQECIEWILDNSNCLVKRKKGEYHDDEFYSMYIDENRIAVTDAKMLKLLNHGCCEIKRKFFLPDYAIKELKSIKPKYNTYNLYVENDKVRYAIETDDFVLYFDPIVERYPDIDAVFPDLSLYTHKIVFDRKAILRKIKEIKSLGIQIQTVIFDLEKNECSFFCRKEDTYYEIIPNIKFPIVVIENLKLTNKGNLVMPMCISELGCEARKRYLCISPYYLERMNTDELWPADNDYHRAVYFLNNL